MKDLSFLLLKNALGAKMRKGFKNFCHGDASTSTLNQLKPDLGEPSCIVTHSHVDGPYLDEADGQPTLEQMILQLELEERMAARRLKLNEYGEIKHRMSCVNSSDILRTARNALNQYPRFSLDGKDSMYRSSFRNMPPPIGTVSRKSSCGSNVEVEKFPHLPNRVAGESVVWCKPGVIAKLMGLDAMPIPLYRDRHGRERLSAIMRRQNLRQRAERHEMERRLVLNASRCKGRTRTGVPTGSSSSRPGYCVMNPVALELASEEDAGWPVRHFL